MDLPSHPIPSMHISLTSCARAPAPPRPRAPPPPTNKGGSNRDYRLVCVCVSVATWRAAKKIKRKTQRG